MGSQRSNGVLFVLSGLAGCILLPNRMLEQSLAAACNSSLENEVDGQTENTGKQKGGGKMERPPHSAIF